MATAGEIFDRIANNIAKAPEAATAMDARFAFDITGDGGGQYTLNLKKGTTSDFLKHEAAEDADVLITMGSDTWTGIFNGSANPMQAFMMGKIKVKGNMGLAMKLQNILSLAK